jgi:hypothetical protein
LLPSIKTYEKSKKTLTVPTKYHGKKCTFANTKMHFRTYPPNALLNSSYVIRDEGGCETSGMGMASV